MARARPPLWDLALLWLGLGAVLVAISSISLIVGANERLKGASFWDNGWARLGAAMALLGVLPLLWALVVVFAHTSRVLARRARQK
jgi:hypothetical protein